MLQSPIGVVFKDLLPEMGINMSAYTRAIMGGHPT